jgi:L-lactate dehydrogenase complex protein LldG
MSERDNILARIREGLKHPAPVAGSQGPSPGTEASEETAAPHIHEWLPSVGDTFDERMALFEKNSADLKTDFRLFSSQQEMTAALSEMAREWKKAAMHSGPLANAACENLDLHILNTNGGYDVNELESCDAGITECDALIAQTGSILVTSRSAGGRALSVLPPHHIVLARREQLLPDLPTAFDYIEARYDNDYPSFLSLITGPSRTGDIERILVLGAHGPKKLTVLCC